MDVSISQIQLLLSPEEFTELLEVMQEVCNYALRSDQEQEVPCKFTDEQIRTLTGFTGNLSSIVAAQITTLPKLSR